MATAIPEIFEGEPVSAEHYNMLVRKINGLNLVSGMDGNSDGGLQLRPRVRLLLAQEDAVVVIATVVDSSDGPTLNRWYPAGIVDVFTGGEEDDLDGAERTLQIEEAKPEHWGNWCIPLADASPGQMVPVVISGITLVRLDRDLDLAFLDRADLWEQTEDVGNEGQVPLRASTIGRAKILWHKNATTGEQWAVIRLETPPEHRKYTNGGTTIIRHGDPLVIDPSEATGIESINDTLALISPADLGGSDDLSNLQWINQGGNVLAGNKGIAVAGAAIANTSGIADDPVGSEFGVQELSDGFAGYRIVASIGSVDSVDRSAVRPFCPHLIFADAVNMVDSANAGTVFVNNGALFFDVANSDEKAVVIHWRKKALNIFDSHMFLTAVVRHFSGFGLGGSFTLMNLTITAHYITEEFDPTTLTWTIAQALSLAANPRTGGAEFFPGVDVDVSADSDIALELDLPGATSKKEMVSGPSSEVHGVMIRVSGANNYTIGNIAGTVDTTQDAQSIYEHYMDIGLDA